MKVWAVANQKGGVGKTTTAVTLAGLLVQRGYKVLLVDTDPHGSLTSYLGYSPDDLERSLYTLFSDPGRAPNSVIVTTKIDHIELLPAAMALATLDRQMGTQSGMGLVLKQVFKGVNADYDYALIDCPPMLGVLMVNALAACDHLLIPVQTEFLALKGLERMVRTVAMITRSRSMELPHTIVPTLFDRRTRASVTALRALRKIYGPNELWRFMIPVDTQFREASQVGQPLPMIAPRSRGVIAYSRLLDSLVEQRGEALRQAVI